MSVNLHSAGTLQVKGAFVEAVAGNHWAFVEYTTVYPAALQLQFFSRCRPPLDRNSPYPLAAAAQSISQRASALPATIFQLSHSTRSRLALLR